MDSENSSEEVKKESKPLTEEALQSDYDIPSSRCTCTDKTTCNFCCIQEYNKALDEIRKPYNDKNNLSCSEIIQKPEIPNVQEEKTYIMDSELYAQLIVKPDDHIYPESNNQLSKKTEDVSLCAIFGLASESCDSNVNSCSLSEKVENGTVCDSSEQTSENCDSKTDSYTECPLEQQQLIEKTDTKTNTDSVVYTFKRSRRSTKRKRDRKDSCPICGLTVRNSELENHFAKEVENLSKIPRNLRKHSLREKGVNITYVQVKCNRENRFSAKVAKYTKKAVKQVTCPVCSLKLTGSEDEINEHVNNCSIEDFDSDVNITDRDDNFEEYEFGNETRVRAISFVNGGHRALYGYSCKSKTTSDNDEDLNVDVDDTLTYGKSQYTELDIIHNSKDSDECKQLEQLRKAVVADPTLEPHVLEFKKWSKSFENKNEEPKKYDCSEQTDESKISNESSSTENKDSPRSVVQDAVVLSLKEKIKTLEQQNKNVKCLICLEPYTKPVVSTTCWHVHCEECWLMSMGVKKLCPQCNLIVFPADLRRIYL